MADITLGLAAWHYPQRDLVGNVRFFADGGFSAFSAIGGAFAEAIRSEAQADALAEALAKRGTVFTVHYKIPDPENAKETAAFDANIPLMRDWQSRYGLLSVLSFDVWGDRRACAPKIEQTVRAFSGSGTVLACEDLPLDAEEAKWFGSDHADTLIDVGHMNLRLSKAGDTSPEAFEKAFASLPFPVRELHLHNNDGVKDLHDLLLNGTICWPQIVKILKKRAYNGIFTIESVPGWHGLVGGEADKAIFACKEQWETLWSEN